MKNKIYTLFTLLLLWIFISCTKQNREYISLSEVPTKQKNWIPIFLLHNEIINQVNNYYECHDLDTNETWGYFSIIGNLLFVENNNSINDYPFFNRKKIEKCIHDLGCSIQINKGHFFQNNEIMYFVIFDDRNSKYYFFGKYR